MNKSNDVQFRVRIEDLEKSNRELRTFINNISASLNDLPDWKYRIERHAETLAEFTIRVKQLELPKVTVPSRQDLCRDGLRKAVRSSDPYAVHSWWQLWK